MLSDERQSIRSPTLSRTDSYAGGNGSKGSDRPYQRRTSIGGVQNEREDNEYDITYDSDEKPRADGPPQRKEDQYIAALRYRFPNRPKTDYSYTKPSGSSIPAAPPVPSNGYTSKTTQPTSGRTAPISTGPYQSTLRRTPGGTSTPDTSDNKTFSRPALRRVTPEQQNTYARRIANETATPPSQSKPIASETSVRINEQNVTNGPTPSTFTRPLDIPRVQDSTFEKVPQYGGPVSYLGTGTFPLFEKCLQECLERERLRTGMTSHMTRHDIPSNVSLQDYGYDPAPPLSLSSIHPMTEPYRSHPVIDYPSRPLTTFLLDDIRQINVALSRSGIPLFPHNQPYHESYLSSSIPISPSRFNISSTYPSERRVIGEVVSACRIVDEDPSLFYNTNRCQAVQNVWNAIQNYHPFSHIDPLRSSVYPKGPYDI